MAGLTKNEGENYVNLSTVNHKAAFGTTVHKTLLERLPNDLAEKHLSVHPSLPSRTVISIGLIHDFQVHVDQRGLPEHAFSHKEAQRIRFLNPTFDSARIPRSAEYVRPRLSRKELKKESEDEKAYKKLAKRSKKKDDTRIKSQT